MVNHGGQRRGVDILLDAASGVREEALTTVWNQAGFPSAGLALQCRDQSRLRRASRKPITAPTPKAMAIV
jgi:hypothetical protein